MKKIKIELQHFHGCPNSTALIERVKEAMKDFENTIYTEVLVDTNEKAKELKFRGSPTLIINGEDFENQPEPESPALSCRYYLKGLPKLEQIKSRLQELYNDQE